MPQPNTYRTLQSPTQAEFKDKGSRFLAFAYPILTLEDVKRHVDALHQTHHKARHCCFAYRLGTDGNQFRANDDGEPSGSAGRPILGQIDSFELTDVLAVVVRYFGGTLLGVPGLIHAYKISTQRAFQAASIVEKNIEKTVILCCDYAHLNEVLHLIKRYHAQVVAQDLQLNCRLTVRVLLTDWAAAIQEWQQMHTVTVDIENPV